MENWKSPRKIEEEITHYKRERFEWYMEQVDSGDMTRTLAISALKDELDNIIEMSPHPSLS